MPSTVVSLRVSEEQAERLQKKARQLGRTPSETGAMLLDESLRRDEFAFIDFRVSPVGRQAYVMGSRLTVWQVVTVVRSFEGNAEAAALHLDWPTMKITAAMNYAEAYPDEIELAIGDAESIDEASLVRTLPQRETIVVPKRRARKR